MELEEAIERLKDDVKNAHLRDIVDDDCTICFTEDVDTVIQELDRLQKENEELKEIDLTTVHIKGVCDEKERWRNKIREKIEECKKFIIDDEHFSPLHQNDKELLEDLLKEE